MRQIEPFKIKKWGGSMPPNPLAMYCKTSNSLKNSTSMFKNRFAPLNVCIRSILYTGNAIIIIVLQTR